MLEKEIIDNTIFPVFHIVLIEPYMSKNFEKNIDSKQIYQ